MSQQLTITRDGNACYDILLRNDWVNLAEAVLAVSNGRKERKICIVSDSNVSPLYIREVREALIAVFSTVTTFEFPAGEASKTLKNVERLYTVLIESHFDRTDLLVALGGGVVGDLTGYTAATYLRGIDFVQVPTTLLSQVDSSIGGKTGVDFSHYKNMVGAFHMPSLVYMNLNTLKSLPDRQFASGMGEVIKHGLIADRTYFDFLMNNSDRVLSQEPSAIEQTVHRSCEIKGAVVEEDPTEKSVRAHLNFGHTIGHAIEKLSDFILFHGECVAIGSVAAGYLSMKRGLISEEDLSAIEKGFQAYSLPIRVPDYVRELFTAEDVLAATKNDKKMIGTHIKFILLKEVGNAYIETGLTDEEILQGIHYVLS
ncbi:MAG: 3-dehydroquinate synthase [Lachnospiraceae bacterium]|nr:3-dehydroquinate synthase [Lachnospiraceae bacterium]